MRSRNRYYERVGRSFKPIHPDRYYDFLDEGSYLIVVSPSNTAIRSILDPDHASVEAALKEVEDELVKAMLEASKLRPMRTQISQKERKAWDEFERAMGDDMPAYFGCYASMQEIVDKGINVVRDKITNCDHKRKQTK